MITENKLCSRCKIEKSIGEFYTRTYPSGLTNLYPWCKECCRSEKKIRYWRDPEKSRRDCKRKELRRGRIVSEEVLEKYNTRKRAQRLALRLHRANLLITLAMEAYEVTNRESLNGRFLFTNYEECVIMASWLVRGHTFLSRNAIAEMFNCSTKDVYTRLKQAAKENSWEQGDIIFRRKHKTIKRKYRLLNPRHWREITVLPYQNYTRFQREGKDNSKFIGATSPPAGLSLELLIPVVCWYYGVNPPEDIHNENTRGGIPKARQVCMYIMNQYLGLRVIDIAQLWNKESSTVTHGIKMGRDVMHQDRGSLYYELGKQFPQQENVTVPG